MKPTTFVICSVNGGYCYEMREGLIHVCRYKSRAAALKHNPWAKQDRYSVEEVRRSRIRAWEAEINEFRDTPHRRRMLEREQEVSEAAGRYLDELHARRGPVRMSRAFRLKD